MVFNSAAFAVFFVVVYALYWMTAAHLRRQNQLIFFSSCLFYAWWDWRFLFLMLLTITIDYFISRRLGVTQEPGKRKRLLAVSVVTNLSILGFFKYFNFFTSSLERFLSLFGMPADLPFLNIILPVGISFYTFQSMSYVIDVYRRQMAPADSLLNYASYVSFFPQLVAGPIERATHLLPQIQKPRRMQKDLCLEGVYLVFWGLFKKMFIADNLAKIVNPVFQGHGAENGILVLLAVYAFAFQIYCDFSGYSDIARGLGKLMGFDIMINFNLPYFSTNPAEFWRRWHISLSTWLRDYIYIPLGGNQKGSLLTYRNLALTMLLGGLWHGAKWTFVVWGAYHGLLLILHRLAGPLLESLPKPRGAFFQKVVFPLKVFSFFHLVCLGWLFFRAESFSQAQKMLSAILTNFRLEDPVAAGQSLCTFVFLTGLLLAVQYFQYMKKDLLVVLKFKPWVQILFYWAVFYLILLFGVTSNEQFIYFQF
jgi:alginate O-acetyltransferase complex protein AlgI